MIVLGLTGSIGMGKSYAAAIFKSLGVPVHNSDHAVHRALSPGGEAFEAVALTFREAWDKKKHLIDRKKLGEIVFQDDVKLKNLEKMLHPIVRQSQIRFLRMVRRAGRPLAVLEIPLLFETGAHRRVDFVVCVSAPAAIQRRRVLARKGMDEDKFERILGRQMPDSLKRIRSDFVIDTGLGKARTRQQIQALIKQVKKS